MFTEEDDTLHAWAAAHDGVFSLVDAARAGLSERQIERRARDSWIRMYRGVYRVAGAPLTRAGELRAACLAGAPNAAVSHSTAAAYHAVPGARRDILEITCPRWFRTVQSGLVVHERFRVTPEDTQLIQDLPVVRPELLALQLAGMHRSPDFAESVLQALRRKRLITYDSMLRVFQRHAGRGVPGSRALRVALERWDPTQRATDSEMETLLLQVLRAHDLPTAVPQFEIFDRNGRFVARVDAAIVEWKATVDYDSKQEHSDEFQIARDNGRRNRIWAAGWHPVVARHRDLLSGGAELAAALRATATRSA